MADFFTYSFLIRALVACVLVGSLTSYLSAFVVQRQMSFMGSGLSHASFGGIALGLLLNISPLGVAAAFTVLVAVLITWFHKNTKIQNDTAIGIFFSITMALGILFISMRESFGVDAMTYLFGSILSVNQFDLLVSGALFILCIAAFPLWKTWTFATFDREFAASEGQKNEWEDYVLSILLALVVIVSVKILGVVLLAAFLVIPGATAALVSRRFIHMTFLSVFFGIVGSVSGLFISFEWDLPSGATIVLSQSTLFIALALWKKIILRRL